MVEQAATKPLAQHVAKLSELVTAFAEVLEVLRREHDCEASQLPQHMAGQRDFGQATIPSRPGSRRGRRCHSIDVGCANRQTPVEFGSDLSTAASTPMLSVLGASQAIDEEMHDVLPRWTNMHTLGLMGRDWHRTDLDKDRPVVGASLFSLDGIDWNCADSQHSGEESPTSKEKRRASKEKRPTNKQVATPGTVPQEEPLSTDTVSEEVEEPLSPGICSALSRDAHLFELRAAWTLTAKQLNQVSRRRKRSTSDDQPYTLHRSPSALSLNGPEVSVQKRRRGIFPLHPHSTVRAIWNVLAVVLLLYDFIVLPMAVFDLPDDPFLIGMTYVTLAYWTSDIAMSFATGCYSNGILIMDWRDIWSQYVRTWLVVDIMLILPDLIFSIAGAASRNSWGLLRTLRGARTLRLLRFVAMLRLMKVDRLVKDLKTRLNSTSLLVCIPIARLICGVLMLCHILAASWYFVGKQSASGWIYAEGIDSKDLADKYLSTLQWSLARLHPANFGKNDALESFPERIFAIAVSLLAFGGGGYFVSCVTTTMAELQNLRAGQSRKLHIIREYVRDNNISLCLSMRIKSYVEKTVSQRARVMHAKQIAEFLPVTLVADLRFEAWTPILTMHPWLSSVTTSSPRFVWSLCKSSLTEIAVLPGDTVFTTTDSCEKMLFVSAGMMSYALGRVMGSGQIQEQKDVRPGQWLSEAALWTLWKHTGELCGELDGTILALDAEELVAAARGHRSIAAEIAYYANKFVKALNQLGDHATDLLPVGFVDDMSLSEEDVRLSPGVSPSNRYAVELY
eukprot:TRINITY_DN12762_c0_g1_i3.p1 TRINITY_DN12762_c0_g1~~TRINITY_DN12762_c0_g1_i3.p1  ORF type:complete len:791 (-),score=112.70 TRINITY_DN12762_c0_g1_i3:367-2739(-)